MAEEFGVTSKQLSGYMNSSIHVAPKPVLRHNKNVSRSAVTYYDPEEMRAWWRLVRSVDK